MKSGCLSKYSPGLTFLQGPIMETQGKHGGQGSHLQRSKCYRAVGPFPVSDFSDHPNEEATIHGKAGPNSQLSGPTPASLCIFKSESWTLPLAQSFMVVTDPYALIQCSSPGHFRYPSHQPNSSYSPMGPHLPRKEPFLGSLHELKTFFLSPLTLGEHFTFLLKCPLTFSTLCITTGP